MKREDNSGIGDCDGVDEPGDCPHEIIVPMRLGLAGSLGYTSADAMRQR